MIKITTILTVQLLASLLIATGTKPMKEVQYRGGLVTFSIPLEWVEEHDPVSGGTFYLDEPDSGTLRLTVQTYQRTGNGEFLTSEAALSGMRSKTCTDIQVLPTGNAICEHVRRAQEDGDRITLYWWQVANVVPPSHVRIASFSYTVLSSQEGSDRLATELRFLRSSIEALRFSKTTGL